MAGLRGIGGEGKRMSRSALTFAEIFIVLALVFLIQTVANFGLFDGALETAVDLAEWETLSIRQVPSGGDATDHVMYLRFSAPGEPELLAQIAEGGVDCRDVRSAFGELGSCVQRAGCRSDPYGSEEDIFVLNLEEQYGISISEPPSVRGTQPQYLLTWSPADLPRGAEVAIGLQFCFLENSEEARKIDPLWELTADGGQLELPHPLVITRTEYRRRITGHSPRMEFAHRDQMRGVREWPGEGGTAWLGWRGGGEGAQEEEEEEEEEEEGDGADDGSAGGALAGVVFSSERCEFVPDTQIRGFAFREVVVPLAVGGGR